MNRNLTAKICGLAAFLRVAASSNPSLNRTFCGAVQLGFISFLPNCPTPQNAG